MISPALIILVPLLFLKLLTFKTSLLMNQLWIFIFLFTHFDNLVEKVTPVQDLLLDVQYLFTTI